MRARLPVRLLWFACGSAVVMFQTARLGLVADRDAQSAALLQRLLRLALRRLSEQYINGEFVFTVTGEMAPDGGWLLKPTGTSVRYGAIAALGLRRVTGSEQCAVLAGRTYDDLVGQLAKRLDEITDVGDAALVCWVAAEAAHSELPHAVTRLQYLDGQQGTLDVVSAAWVVSALVAARHQVDVEQHLAAARQRLLAARGAIAYPHTTNGAGRWYRAHVGSFADQVYPIQALARLHGSADDPEALAVAEAVTRVIVAAQGASGQWWWHYDSRTGTVVEGYPVYTVHQHAMAPMALLDLADAGNENHLDAICSGLRWLADRPESPEALVIEEPPITWRKIARGDQRKVVRGARAFATGLRPGLRLHALDWVFRPGVIDRECRPYELGWLLMTWLS